MEDLLSIAVLIALTIGFIRRYVEKPLRFQDKLENDKRLNRDATIILFAVALHIIFATLLEAFEIGLVNKVVNKEKLETELKNIIEKLCQVDNVTGYHVIFY